MASFKITPTRWIFFILSLSIPLKASFPPEISAQVLYFIHQGKVDRGLGYYLEYSKETSSHDFELLQQAACTLLEEGASSKDPEILLMCLFGAGVSLNPAMLPVLEAGLHSMEPKLQLASLNFLSRFHDDEADRLLREALSSPFLLIRLQTALLLAQKKDPLAIEHLQSLLVKVPPMARQLFPQIVAPIESPAATKLLRQFLSDPDVAVRCEAILQVGEHQLDDLLPTVYALATHPDPSIQECCAITLAMIKDERSLPYFQKWLIAKQSMVRLAALKGLSIFGDQEALLLLEEEAKSKNHFAIPLVDPTSSAKSILQELLKDTDPSTRLNAALRLLEFKEMPSLASLKEILVRDEKDLGFTQQYSLARGFKAWKVILHAEQKAKLYPALKSQTLRVREKVMRMSLELPEEEFLKVARLVFEHQQIDLLPLLTELLCNHKSPAAIALLKEQQQKTGAPFIRNYCNLALYRLQEAGPYEEYLLRWVKEEQQNALIQFREDEPIEKGGSYELTPEETSQLLIESFEALASAQNQAGIEALIKAIAYGNAKNRYALAGLLMRTSE